MKTELHLESHTTTISIRWIMIFSIFQYNRTFVVVYFGSVIYYLTSKHYEHTISFGEVLEDKEKPTAFNKSEINSTRKGTTHKATIRSKNETISRSTNTSYSQALFSEVK